jgi:hypothetical protein
MASQQKMHKSIIYAQIVKILVKLATFDPKLTAGHFKPDPLKILLG